MLISASTTRADRYPGRNQAGFSLLELLVVVVLLGLLMMVMVPQLVRDDTGRLLRQESNRISDMVGQLTEQALFRGDLLALQLRPDSVEPLRYDWQENAFVPFESGPLVRHQLPEGLALEWESAPVVNDGQPTLADAADVLLADESPGGNDVLVADADTGELPQVFFFPSGEVSPLTLRLYAPESSLEQELSITALGTTDEDDDEEAADE